VQALGCRASWKRAPVFRKDQSVNAVEGRHDAGESEAPRLRPGPTGQRSGMWAGLGRPVRLSAALDTVFGLTSSRPRSSAGSPSQGRIPRHSGQRHALKGARRRARVPDSCLGVAVSIDGGEAGEKPCSDCRHYGCNELSKTLAVLVTRPTTAIRKARRAGTARTRERSHEASALAGSSSRVSASKPGSGGSAGTRRPSWKETSRLLGFGVDSGF